MRKIEILQEIGRRHGDTGESYRDTYLSPALNFVLLDLAQYEAIPSLRRPFEFIIEAGRREYDTREICDLAGDMHPPWMLEELTVYSWGPIVGRINQVSYEGLRNLRLLEGEEAAGKWKVWSVSLNPFRFRVQPPASAEEDGDTAEIVCTISPSILDLEDDITEIRREHLETLVYGVEARMAVLKDETQSDGPIKWQLYIEGRNRMWGHRFNARVRQLAPFPF